MHSFLRNTMKNNCGFFQSKCSNIGLGGRTIHCLMKHAAQHQLDSPECEKAIGTLLREVDVASDWKVDPILHENW
jgi:hypothetical protein